MFSHYAAELQMQEEVQRFTLRFNAWFEREHIIIIIKIVLCLPMLLCHLSLLGVPVDNGFVRVMIILGDLMVWSL